VFNGHMHWNHMEVIDNVPYITVGSLVCCGLTGGPPGAATRRYWWKSQELFRWRSRVGFPPNFAVLKLSNPVPMSAHSTSVPQRRPSYHSTRQETFRADALLTLRKVACPENIFGCHTVTRSFRSTLVDFSCTQLYSKASQLARESIHSERGLARMAHITDCKTIRNGPNASLGLCGPDHRDYEPSGDQEAFLALLSRGQSGSTQMSWL